MGAAWRLRGYTVERLLGSGASGEVWRAHVNGSGEPVALKRITVADRDQARRAETEAALLSALDHPHLVRLHALLPVDGATVLVLDLADGGSLDELLTVRGRLTPGEVITAIAPIAAGLAYLHDEGVVHGDVSAGNILFTPPGVPLLADVGVARLTGDDTDAASTAAYLDPAVAAGCVPGPQSDVFMLAAVALHALTGEPPWPADSGEAAIALAAQGVLDDVAERLARAQTPADMVAVLCRALAVDPHRRGTAADLALDLRHSGEPVAVELSAGRGRSEPAAAVRSGPRHAARPAEPRSTETAVHVDERAMPSFERTSGVPGGAGQAPPTRMVGPRPRPAIPRPRRRAGRRRTMLIALAVALCGLLAAAGTVWATTRDGEPAAHAPVMRSSSPAASSHVKRSTSPPSHSPPKTPTVNTQTKKTKPKAPAAGEWQTALVGLDAMRARAFQARDPKLLARVYVPGPLLTADTALLRRLVPPGCGLAGARTRYTHMRAAMHGSRVRITVTAILPPSRLICARAVRGTAPGAGPAHLRLELARTSGGLRIAEQQVR